MRTTIDLDDKTLAQAMKMMKVKTKREAVHIAMKEFVERHERRQILEMYGSSAIDPDCYTTVNSKRQR